MFVALYETGEVRFCLFGTNGFHAKAETQKFIAVGLHCRQNLKYEIFTPRSGTLRQNCSKKRAARAARLSLLIKPIKSLIFGVVVAVVVVISQTPYYQVTTAGLG